MDITIKQTNKKHFFQTLELTREAFWNLYQSGCDEHLALYRIRKSQSYLPELDFIALKSSAIIGHIIATKAMVLNDSASHEILCLGPVSVLPAFQGQGIGSRMIRHIIAESAARGHKGIILYGNPDYYHRFGFSDARNFRITNSKGQNFAAFMALELKEGALKTVYGKLFESQAYETKPEELECFDRQFTHKVKGAPKIKLDL